MMFNSNHTTMSGKKYDQSKALKNLWILNDSPQAKLLNHGKSNLTNSEILAMIVGTEQMQNSVELARTVLMHANGILDNLYKMSVTDLMNIENIGKARACRIFAALELGRRRSEENPERPCLISSASDVFNLMNPILKDEVVEHFWTLLLNRRNAVIHKYHVSKGGISGTLADPKVIFKAALQYNATGIILVHNHPSGNPKPSEADIKLTRDLVASGKLLDIRILDHVIYCGTKYYSFIDKGLL